MSQAGLKSGILSVEKDKGARKISMRMRACENCFRIERPYSRYNEIYPTLVGPGNKLCTYEIMFYNLTINI
jgi:hypothetical protein